MKPIKKWDWFDRIWFVLALVIIGFQVNNIIEVFTEENSYEPLTLGLGIFVILIWCGLIYNQLWAQPKRQAKWKAEMDKWDADYKKALERFNQDTKKK